MQGIAQQGVEVSPEFFIDTDRAVVQKGVATRGIVVCPDGQSGTVIQGESQHGILVMGGFGQVGIACRFLTFLTFRTFVRYPDSTVEHPSFSDIGGSYGIPVFSSVDSALHEKH